MSRRAPGLLFAMVFPTLMAWFYFVALAPTSPGQSRANGFLVMAAYVAGKIVQFTFPLLYVWMIERRPVRPAPPHFRGLALGVGFGLVVAAVTLALYFSLHTTQLFADVPDKIRAKVGEFGLNSPGNYILFAVFLAAGHSLLEEYYWRWFVFGQLRGVLPRWAAILISSLAFMAHHVIVLAVYFPGKFWSLAVPLALCVAAGGTVWAWLYDRTGSVYSSWVSHLIIDGAILAVGYQMVFG